MILHFFPIITSLILQYQVIQKATFRLIVANILAQRNRRKLLRKMNIKNSTSNTTGSQIKISEKDSKELFIKNQSKIISVLNESFIAFSLLDIIDNSNTSNIMKLKIETILKDLSSLEE